MPWWGAIHGGVPLLEGAISGCHDRVPLLNAIAGCHSQLPSLGCHGAIVGCCWLGAMISYWTSDLIFVFTVAF